MTMMMRASSVGRSVGREMIGCERLVVVEELTSSSPETQGLKKKTRETLCCFSFFAK